MAETATLDPIVLDVTVNLSAAPGGAEGFGIPLVAGPNPAFAERVRYYDAASDILADTDASLSSSSPEYIAAAAMFSNGAKQVGIGRAAVSVAEVQTATIATPAAGDWDLVIDGTTYTYTAGGGDTAANVGDGLRTAAAAETGVTLGGTGATITFTSVRAGVAHTITITPAGGGAASIVETTPNVDMGAEIAAINAEDGAWYGLVTTAASTVSNHEDDVLRVAAWAETERVLYVAQTNDADVIASGSSDIASLVKALSYKHTSVWYHSSSSAPLAGAIVGKVLSIDPDYKSTTWAHHTLSGVSTDTMTATARANALGKYANIYLTLKGAGASYAGRVASGHWCDEILASHWWAARIEEGFARVFADASAKGSKIPQTDVGDAQLEAPIRETHAIGVAAGHFDPAENDLTITFAARTDATKAARTRAVSAGCTLAGAVHTIAATFYLDN